MSKFKVEHPLGTVEHIFPRVESLTTRGFDRPEPPHPLPCADKRKAEAARIKEKYPDRIPVSLGSGVSSGTGSGTRVSCSLRARFLDRLSPCYQYHRCWQLQNAQAESVDAMQLHVATGHGHASLACPPVHLSHLNSFPWQWCLCASGDCREGREERHPRH